MAADLLRWVARRGPRDIGPGALAVPYAGAQAALMYGLAFAAVVETVVLALVVPWPLVHAIALVVDVWGVFFVLGLQASCVMRPHVVEADGSLRVRYGPFLDVRIPASSIADVRAERRYSGTRAGRVDADGVADVAVGSETAVTVRLTGAVGFPRGDARTVRLSAADPAAVVSACRQAREQHTGEAADGRGKAVGR